jgi:DNA-directed RNA polymerase specialized sigma24 family protein
VLASSNLYPVSEDQAPKKSIAEILESLPEEERLILTMHYVYQVSAAEIAGKLDVPERAVLTVIASGRSRLISSIF